MCERWRIVKCLTFIHDVPKRGEAYLIVAELEMENSIFTLKYSSTMARKNKTKLDMYEKPG